MPTLGQLNEHRRVMNGIGLDHWGSPKNSDESQIICTNIKSTCSAKKGDQCNMDKSECVFQSNKINQNATNTTANK